MRKGRSGKTPTLQELDSGFGENLDGKPVAGESGGERVAGEAYFTAGVGSVGRDTLTAAAAAPESAGSAGAAARLGRQQGGDSALTAALAVPGPSPNAPGTVGFGDGIP